MDSFSFDFWFGWLDWTIRWTDRFRFDFKINLISFLDFIQFDLNLFLIQNTKYSILILSHGPLPLLVFVHFAAHTHKRTGTHTCIHALGRQGEQKDSETGIFLVWPCRVHLVGVGWLCLPYLLPPPYPHHPHTTTPPSHHAPTPTLPLFLPASADPSGSQPPLFPCFSGGAPTLWTPFIHLTSILPAPFFLLPACVPLFSACACLLVAYVLF